MAKRRLGDYRTAVFDCETDPFKKCEFVQPFCCGFLTDDGIYMDEWGDDCIDSMMARILALEGNYLIYVHNGGKFDFHFLWRHVEQQSVLIINGRLVEFTFGQDGKRPKHVWRDSLSIIPVPLADYQKTEIDYSKFERHCREKHRKEILAYQRDDCRDLLQLVQQFRVRFQDDNGTPPITIGQTAMRQFEQWYSFERATPTTDALMRQWYLGGRTQCFASGVLKGPWVYYDLNSSYPSSMRNFVHPLTDQWEQCDKPPRAGVWFADVIARNRNALATKEGPKTEFHVAEGRFFAVSHELILAQKLGLVEVLKWNAIFKPARTGNFAKFVDYFYSERKQAIHNGDKANSLFLKLVMNSCYGKFGTNPADFRDYYINTDLSKDATLELSGYEPVRMLSDDPYCELFAKPARAFDHSYYNVGIAASITSASRSLMLQGLADADEPVYCDTDSVICRAFHGDIDDERLGAWKPETWIPPSAGETWRTKRRKGRKVPIVADYIAIGGRKLYCLFNKEGRKVIPIKWASKGADLEPMQIIDVARGGEVDFVSDRPIFSLTRGQRLAPPKHIRNTAGATVGPFRAKCAV